MMGVSISIDREQAIARYLAVQDRLPSAQFPKHSIAVDNLEALTSEIDVFVLDGFGVLNVGDQPVPDAVDRITKLQAAGCEVWVLTNGATMPAQKSAQKYAKWGFTISPTQVVSSRDALMRGMSRHAAGLKWGIVATDFAQIDLLSPDAVLLEDDPQAYEACDAFVFLSSLNWSDHRHQLLTSALLERPRPLLVGNPDLVAPHEARISIEPGYFSHQIQDETGVIPEFYGKPFPDAFDIVSERLAKVAPDRIAMVGDTLHTDILGGAAAGWKTVLITDFGLLKGRDVAKAIAQSGIVPDYIAPVT
jgi:HAD superfamily hydrolase (TIGR01450 family)